MARNRVIYQSEALFVSKTGESASGNIHQIHRVQNANYSFDLARQDINQFGQLAAIDRIILEQPTVSLDFSYYTETGLNESNIGLDLNVSDQSAISSILSGDDLGANQEAIKTYYIQTADEGNDRIGQTSNAQSVIGIGNGFLTSYSVEGSVGDFVSSSVNVEGLNMVLSKTSTNSVPDPTVDPADGEIVNPGDAVTMPTATDGLGTALPKALRHGDVTLSLHTSGALGFDVTSTADFHAQNFTYSFELSRTNLEKLGSRFAYSKEIEFPTTASLDVSAIIGDLNDAQATDSYLSNIVNSGEDVEMDLAVSCKGAVSTVSGIQFKLLGGKLDSQGFSSSIGDNKTMDLSYSTQIGGPQDTTHGIAINTITS